MLGGKPLPTGNPAIPGNLRSESMKTIRTAFVAVILKASLMTSAFSFATNQNKPASPLNKAEAAKEEANKTNVPGAVEVRFSDGRTQKITLADERLELITPYGKLQIPVAAIHRIDFASRIPKEVVKQVDAAVANLASEEFQKREEASATLLKLREKSYSALLIAAEDRDPEVVRRAEDVLKKLRAMVPEEDLEFHKQDIVQTEDSKIAGRIEMTELKTRGDARIKVVDLRSVRSLAIDDGNNVAVAPDPGNLKALEKQVGKTFKFRVTGAANGSVWGTNIYTTDSTLATVAVHAGVLKVGQTGVVKVKIVTPPPQFEGSSKNGVTTGPWNAYPGAYQVSK
jgi:hypothetical protein